jgi:hypothetical protein
LSEKGSKKNDQIKKAKNILNKKNPYKTNPPPPLTYMLPLKAWN